jgi:enterochelin esterase family protein
MGELSIIQARLKYNEIPMNRIIASLFLILLSGCGAISSPTNLATLPEGCTASGKVIRAELSEPTRGYAYTYRVYLPPCFSAESESKYPVLYLVPGMSSGPDSWFNPGLAEIVDGLILKGEIPPLFIVTTESTTFDPMADTIYRELIPYVESQYPIVNDRRYRAVAGGSLGGIAVYRLAFQYPDKFSSAAIFGAGAISGEEKQIDAWLSSMTDANRIRVFMDVGDEDFLVLDRAQVMKSILDEAGIENQLHVGRGGHNYAYWVSNFEMYLKWLTRGW